MNKGDEQERGKRCKSEKKKKEKLHVRGKRRKQLFNMKQS